jgi:hypothetical protein
MDESVNCAYWYTVILIFIYGIITELLHSLPQGAGTFVSKVSFNFHSDINWNL